MVKFVLWLRWTLLVPLSLAGVVLGTLVGIFVNLHIGADAAEKYSWLYMAGDFLGGFLSASIGVLVACAVAPQYKQRVGLIVSAVCLVLTGQPYYVSHSWTISRGDVIEWALVAGGVCLGALVGLTIVSSLLKRDEKVLRAS